jgi:type IV pilus assembly protein PilF
MFKLLFHQKKIVLLVLLASMLSLLGCTTMPTVKNHDLLTESDDSPARIKAQSRLDLAIAYLQENKLMFALDNVKRAIKDDSNYSDAYNVRGLIYMRLNELPLAEESFQTALQLNKNDADTLNNYGWFLCQQQRYRESSIYFKKSLANAKNTNNSQVKALTNFGICQMREGLAESAESNLLAAFQLDAQNPYISYSLMQLYWSTKNYERAQYYAQLINNTHAASAKSLWLGIKIEHAMSNKKNMQQLGTQLLKRFSNTLEAKNWERGAFND